MPKFKNAVYASNGSCLVRDIEPLAWARKIPPASAVGTRSEKGCLSNLIRDVEPGFSSHIMFADGTGTNRIPGEANVISADTYVVENTIVHYIQDSKGEYDPGLKMVAYAIDGFSGYQIEDMVNEGIKYVGRPYNYKGAANFVLPVGNSSNGFYCSQLTAHIYLRTPSVRIRIYPLGISPSKVSPGDIDRWFLSEEARALDSAGLTIYVVASWNWYWDDEKDRQWFYDCVFGKRH